MGNCLVTKLKAVVNNPDLPVFESLQHFTLDAITRGGNKFLTDSQKWALNHFFYEIGAISDSALWDKVNTLLLPIIGADKAHIGLDYKDLNCSLTLEESVVDQGGALEISDNGGVYQTVSLILSGRDYTNPITPFGTLLVCTTPQSSVDKGTTAVVGVTVRDTSTVDKTRYYRDISSLVAANQYIATRQRIDSNGVEIRSSAEQFIAAAYRYDGSNSKMYSIDEAGNYSCISGVTGEMPEIPSTITANTTAYTLGSGTKYGIIIDFNAYLTESEIQNILRAAENLRNSFK